MKKIYALMAAVAAFGMVACQPDNKPGEEQGGNQEEVQAPVADFEYAADGLTVSFTNKSQNATGYKWSFGDDETSKEANPTHEYGSAGEYTVVLTASNAKGQDKKEVKITLAGKVKAYFSYTVPEGRAGVYGKKVSFDATSSANAVSIAWNFGDGETSTEFAPVHEFPGFETYTVSATVTGADGATDTYTQDVTCVKNTSLIKCGGMEADDAEFWTPYEYWGYDAGQYVDVPGVWAYGHEWGNTDNAGFGKGGCFKFISNPLGWDYNNKGAIYTTFDVVEGDVIEMDCLVKWGEETQDNGGFSIRLSYDEYSLDGALLFWFENFWGVHDPDDDDPTRWTRWVPAFEGNLAACAEALSEYGAEAADAELVDGKLRFTAVKTGKAHLIFYINQVWGFACGEGRDIYIDEVTVDAVVD